jgi:ACR3 family arsenite transporter
MITRFLWAVSTHARACLILGLLAGLLLPGLAGMLVVWLPQMVALLLTTTALRIGHRAAVGAMRDLRWGLGAVVVLQVMVPLSLLGLLVLADLQMTPAALAIVLACAAPAITGSVNLALIMRLDAGRMMQILVLGTAAFPLTVLPVLFFLPQLGPADQVILSALKLLAVIAVATAAGFALRVWLFPEPTEAQTKALDGLSVLAFCVIVVGLMAGLNPALRSDAWVVAQWALLAFAISYLMQLFTLLILRRSALRGVAGPLAIGAGNRNIAIFLVALPPEVLAPLMIFIGCWQLPMYLTPMLLPQLYKWALDND